MPDGRDGGGQVMNDRGGRGVAVQADFDLHVGPGACGEEEEGMSEWYKSGTEWYKSGTRVVQEWYRNTAVHCSTLQYSAVQCSTVQYSAVHSTAQTVNRLTFGENDGDDVAIYVVDDGFNVGGASALVAPKGTDFDLGVGGRGVLQIGDQECQSKRNAVGVQGGRRVGVGALNETGRAVGEIFALQNQGIVGREGQAVGVGVGQGGTGWDRVEQGGVEQHQ
jgi:hypothetical protein